MSTIASTFPTARNSLLRLSVIGGLIIGLLHLIFQVGVVYDLLLILQRKVEGKKTE